MKKIISNYTIDGENSKQINDQIVSKVPPVIKIPVLQNSQVHINSESNVAHMSKEPILHLNRNNEGIVLSIEVQCTCGEKIIIKLDY